MEHGGDTKDAPEEKAGRGTRGSKDSKSEEAKGGLLTLTTHIHNGKVGEAQVPEGIGPESGVPQ